MDKILNQNPKKQKKKILSNDTIKPEHEVNKSSIEFE